MKPPDVVDVRDKHGGFTCETTGKRSGTNTLWRPGRIIRSFVGTLISYDEKSFYQQNDDVTRAVYKVSGYRYPVICWFDNKTGERIA